MGVAGAAAAQSAAWSAWDTLSTLEMAVMVPELAFALYLITRGRVSRTTPLPLAAGCLAVVYGAGFALTSVISIPPANKIAFDDILALPLITGLAVAELHFIRRLRSEADPPLGE